MVFQFNFTCLILFFYFSQLTDNHLLMSIQNSRSQELSEVNKCSKIDVLEIDQEIIDYIISSGHLNSDINLIQGDIYNYTTTETYDLIIIDTIWHEHEMSDEVYDLLVSRLLPNINTGGALYVPIKNKFLFVNFLIVFQKVFSLISKYLQNLSIKN